MACFCTTTVRAGHHLLFRRAATAVILREHVWHVVHRCAATNSWTSANASTKGRQDPAFTGTQNSRPASRTRKSTESRSLFNRDCVSLADFSREEIENILWTAVDLKQQSLGSGGGKVSVRVGESGSPLGRANADRSSMRMPKPGGTSGSGISPIRQHLDGVLSHLIFETPDMHQRLSVEAGLTLLGGATSYLAPGDIHFTEPEALTDTMSTFAACSNLLWCRLHNHEFVEQLARECSVPLVNAGSSRESPVIALSHLLTLYETYGTLRGLTLALIGPPTAVLNSLLLCASHFAAKITIVVPPTPESSAEISGGVDSSILSHALRNCTDSNGEIHSVSDVQDALWRTHVVFCGSPKHSSLVNTANNNDAEITSASRPALPKNVKSLVRRDVEDQNLPSLATFLNGKLAQRLISPPSSADINTPPPDGNNRLEQHMFEQADLEWTFLHSLPRTSKEVSNAVHFGENSRTYNSVANRKWICAALALLLTRPYKPVTLKPNFMNW